MMIVELWRNSSSATAVLFRGKDCNHVVRMAGLSKPDVVIIDISFLNQFEIISIAEINKSLPDAKIVVIVDSNQTSSHITQSLGFIDHCLHKSSVSTELPELLTKMIS